MCFAFVRSEIKHFVDYEGVVFNCERLLLSHASTGILFFFFLNVLIYSIFLNFILFFNFTILYWFCQISK